MPLLLLALHIILKSLAFIQSMYQCLSYIKYGKLSHYLKIPPRDLFVAQIYACVVSSLLTWFTAQIILTSNRDNILASLNNPSTSAWTLQGVTLYYTASVIWGVIGPAKFFVSTKVATNDITAHYAYLTP